MKRRVMRSGIKLLMLSGKCKHAKFLVNICCRFFSRCIFSRGIFFLAKDAKVKGRKVVGCVFVVILFV